jgi:hypothetical protein
MLSPIAADGFLQKAPKMQHWPSVLERAKESLETILDRHPPALDQQQDHTQRLLDSLVDCAKQYKGQKWLSNFDVAAMQLSIHLKARLVIMYSNSTKYIDI